MRSKARPGPTRRSTLSAGLLTILAGTAAIAVVSCSEHDSATNPISSPVTLEQRLPVENPFLEDDLVTQPVPDPGKGDPSDDRIFPTEPLPEESLPPIDSTVDLEPAPDDGAYVPDIEHLEALDAGTTTKSIDGRVGGVIERGPFRVDVPADAVDGIVQFEVRIPDNGAIHVSLTPHGMKFDKPVILTIDLTHATGLGEHVVLYWWDEKGKQWENIGGAYDPMTHQLVTKLEHFSTYAPGRAGWKGGAGKPEDSSGKKDNKEQK